MKITKYPQSCLFVETKDIKILVDAGNLKYQENFLETWKQADIILITHKHGDHCYREVLKNLNIPLYGTKEVAKTYEELKWNIVRENDILTFQNTKIEVVKAIHGYNPNLKGGKVVLENVGYIIDDGEKRLYITSDTICFENNYKADVVALPVTAHGLTMSSYEAALLAKDLEAKLVLPIHIDNDTYKTDLEYMKKTFEKFSTPYKVLEIEEKIEI